MRINKFIAGAGVSGRREADRLITEGRVKVNGRLAAEPGLDVDEFNDAVYVDGVRIDPVRREVYIMLNKPKGCITSVKDDKGRKTVMDYVECGKRVFPVGRLDYDSEGLVILTNDGDLAYNLTASKNNVPKSYIVKAEGKVKEEDLKKLRSGIALDGVLTKPAKVTLISFENGISRLEMTITEGRNRQIRRMFAALGLNVVFLKRSEIAGVRLGGLARGAWRYLTPKEVKKLKESF